MFCGLHLEPSSIKYLENAQNAGENDSNNYLYVYKSQGCDMDFSVNVQVNLKLKTFTI